MFWRLRKGETVTNNKKKSRRIGQYKIADHAKCAYIEVWIHAGKFEEDEKSAIVAWGAAENNVICFSALWRS